MLPSVDMRPSVRTALAALERLWRALALLGAAAGAMLCTAQ